MSSGYTIFSLDRAWTLVGRVVSDPREFPNPGGEPVIVEDVHIIRVWGTDAGLGQLNKGIRTGTELDPIWGQVRINPDRIIWSYEPEIWHPRPHPPAPERKSNARIFVLNRAWVLSGTPTYQDRRTLLTTGTDVVRLWGVSKGIGQLSEGPTNETKLDPVVPQTWINPRHLIYDFDLYGWPDRGLTGFAEYQQANEPERGEKFRAQRLERYNKALAEKGKPPLTMDQFREAEAAEIDDDND